MSLAPNSSVLLGLIQVQSIYAKETASISINVRHRSTVWRHVLIGSATLKISELAMGGGSEGESVIFALIASH